MKIPNFVHRFFRGHLSRSEPHECAALQHAWGLTARLAAVPDLYPMIVPTDLADLIRDAKLLHPEIAQHAIRRDAAVRDWAARAKQSENL
jgi:hypothetical protein